MILKWNVTGLRERLTINDQPGANWLSTLPTYPHGLWNVENFLWKNRSENLRPHSLWKSVEKFTPWVWKKSHCRSKKNGSFPHNFSLRLLILPNLFID